MQFPAERLALSPLLQMTAASVQHAYTASSTLETHGCLVFAVHCTGNLFISRMPARNFCKRYGANLFPA